MSRFNGPTPRHSRDNSSDSGTYVYCYSDDVRSRVSFDNARKPRNSPKPSMHQVHRAPDDYDRRKSQQFEQESEVLYDSSSDEDEMDIRPKGADPASSTSRGLDDNDKPAVSPHRAARGNNEYSTEKRPSPVPAAATLPPTYQTPRGRPPLQPNWIPQFSIPHDRWFYYNTATGKSQWEAPGFEPKTSRDILREEKKRRKLYEKQLGKSSAKETTKMLLSIAGGIAAGALLARALDSERPRSSASNRPFTW